MLSGRLRTLFSMTAIATAIAAARDLSAQVVGSWWVEVTSCQLHCRSPTQKCRHSYRRLHQARLPQATMPSDAVESLRRTRHIRHLPCRLLPVLWLLHHCTSLASNLVVRLQTVPVLSSCHPSGQALRILEDTSQKYRPCPLRSWPWPWENSWQWP